MAIPSLRRLGREALERLGVGFHGISTSHVVWGYRLLLDRDPESAAVVEHHLSVCRSVKELRDYLLASDEFRRQNSPDAAKAKEVELGDLSLRHFTGVDLWIHENDQIYSGTPDDTRYEPNVDALFRESVRPGHTVIDVGANMGYFTVLAGKLAGRDGRVFAVEVRPENSWMVQRNVEHAGLRNVDVWPVALWDSVGHHIIPRSRVNPDGIPTSNRQLGTSRLDTGALVPTLPLDFLAADLQRLDLLKLDIEGAEYRAILGAQKTLRRLRPRMIMEFSPAYIKQTSGDDGRELLRLLRALGYQITIVARGGARTECGFDVDRCMAEWRSGVEGGVPHLDLLLDVRGSGEH